MSGTQNLEQCLEELRRSAGIEFRTVCGVLCAACRMEQPTVAMLVEATAVPFRRVREILQGLPAGAVTLGGGTAAELSFAPGLASELARCLDCAGPDDPGRPEAALAAGSQTTGSQTTGSQTTGPQTTGPQTTGPQTTGPQTTGPQTTGGHGTGGHGTGGHGTGGHGTGGHGIGGHGTGGHGIGAEDAGTGGHGTGGHGIGAEDAGTGGAGEGGGGEGSSAEDRINSLLEAAAAGLPPSLWALDHVPATVGTMLRRARYLTQRYDLAGRHLVLLGDHDLTAVAAALLEPGLSVSVVDIDERLLEYLAGLSERLGLGGRLRLYAGDLRLGLPPSLRGSGDLVFTDPPYSREGVELFVRRGLEALSGRPGGRVVFCYGTNDREADKLLATQELLVRLHLVLEELVAGFNRYHGAYAIGAASSLWVCRPTRLTQPAAAAVAARIYSRGRASRESGPETIDAAVRALVGAAAEKAGGSVGLVGEGWGEFNLPGVGSSGISSARISLTEYLDAATELPNPGARRAWADVLAVNLDRFYGSSLHRVLLAAPSRVHLLVVADAKALAGVTSPAASPGLRRVLGARFDLRVIAQAHGPVAGVLSAVPKTPTADAGWVLAYLQDHQAAKLRNAWREALCDLAYRQGGACTKNQARALVESSGITAAELDSRLLELPISRLAAVAHAVVATMPRPSLDPRSGG